MESPEDFTPVEDEAFGAKEGYLKTVNTGMYSTWVLKYEDKAVLLDTDIPLSDRQKQIIGEKFITLAL